MSRLASHSHRRRLSFAIQHVHLGVQQRPADRQLPQLCTRPSFLQGVVRHIVRTLRWPIRIHHCYRRIQALPPLAQPHRARLLRSATTHLSPASLSQLSLSSPTIASSIEGTVSHTVTPVWSSTRNNPSGSCTSCWPTICTLPPTTRAAKNCHTEMSKHCEAVWAITSRSLSCKSLIFANRWLTIPRCSTITPLGVRVVGRVSSARPNAESRPRSRLDCSPPAWTTTGLPGPFPPPASRRDRETVLATSFRQQRHGRAVVEHVAQSLDRISRVERHIRSACLQHSQQTYYHLQAALQTDWPLADRPHSQLT